MPSSLVNKDKYCKMCHENGRISKLRLYQINFEEAITLCEFSKCTYPLGSNPAECLVTSRSFTSLPICSSGIQAGVKRKVSPLRRSTIKSPGRKQPCSISRTKQRINQLLNSANVTNKPISSQNVVPTKFPEKSPTLNTNELKLADVPMCESVLTDTREFIRSKLSLVLKCAKGLKNSPVFAAPSLIKDNKTIADMFTATFNSSTLCTNCNYHVHEKIEDVLLKVSGLNVSVGGPSFRSSITCPSCHDTEQFTLINPVKLSRCVIVCYAQGVSSWTAADQCDFEHDNSLYQVTGVIQYGSNPDNFITWIRDNAENKWMKCDDVQELKSRCNYRQPEILCGLQVHMLLWERLSTPQKNCGFPEKVIVLQKHLTQKFTSYAPSSNQLSCQTDDVFDSAVIPSPDRTSTCLESPFKVPPPVTRSGCRRKETCENSFDRQSGDATDQDLPINSDKLSTNFTIHSDKQVLINSLCSNTFIQDFDYRNNECDWPDPAKPMVPIYDGNAYNVNVPQTLFADADQLTGFLSSL